MDILICTQNSSSQSLLLSKAESLGYSPTITSSILDASNSLASKKFAATLVDAALGIDKATELLMLAWKHNPLLYGAIFSVDKNVPQLWKAQLYGAEMFSGPSYIDNIALALESFSKVKVKEGIANRKLLFIEDLDAPRQIVETYLQTIGYENVVSCSNAQLALEELNKNPSSFFCIISDIKMPNMDGIELARIIRRTEDLKYIPIIFLTAVPSIENVVAALKAGATGFLVKPPERRLLRMEVEKAIRIFLNHQSPRLCLPEEAHLLENALREQMKIL